jgi:hypothetical protein
LRTRYRDGRPHEAVETEAIGQRVLIDILRAWLAARLPELLERVLTAEPGMWHGHLAVAIGDAWLLDATLDHANKPDEWPPEAFVGPVVVKLNEKFWEPPPTPSKNPQKMEFQERYGLFAPDVP